MRILIDIPDEDYKKINSKEKIITISCDIASAIKNGTPIPDNATNEEAIRALFPYTIFVEDRSTNRIVISKEWWNAPYQKGGKK